MKSDEFATRAQLIEDAYRRKSESSVLSLASLAWLMRERSGEHPYLSSVYFAGAEVDHPYFLQNEKIAIGIAVLPEDAAKAGRWRRHTTQTEVIFVLEGEMVVEFRDSSSVTQHRLSVGQMLPIPPGVCHYVLPVNDV